MVANLTKLESQIIKNKEDNALENLRIGFVHAGYKELKHMQFVSKESIQTIFERIVATVES